MCRKKIGFYIAIVTALLTLSTAASAQFRRIATKPTFSINGTDWHPWVLANQKSRDLRIYSHTNDPNKIAKDFSEALLVYVTSEPEDAEQIERALQTSHPAQTYTPEVIAEGENFWIHSATLDNSERGINHRLRAFTQTSALPQFLVATAFYQDVRKGMHVVLQFHMKPVCKKCLDSYHVWIERLKSAQFDLERNEIYFDSDEEEYSIPLQKIGEPGSAYAVSDLARQQSPELSDWLAEQWAYLSGGTLAAVIARLVGGAAGATGNCGKNLAVCTCAMNAGQR